jgi:mono/diheme cytochrome c family protein
MQQALAKFVLTAALFLFWSSASGPEGCSSQEQVPPAGEAGRGDRERLLAIGRKLFAERCSRCHGEEGEKPFGVGPPFNDRSLELEEITRAVQGRFKEKTEEEQRAVILYNPSPSTDPRSLPLCGEGGAGGESVAAGELCAAPIWTPVPTAQSMPRPTRSS